MLFSLGPFGNAGPTTIVVQLQLYYTKYLGYDATILGNVRGIATFLDAVTDPLMGYISDRTSGRFGRRMPYIALGSLFYASGVIGMWFAPAGLTAFQFYAFLLTMQVLFTVGITMTNVPYTALIPELATEYRARTTLVSWMQVGTYLGTTWGGFVRSYTSWRGDEVKGFQEFAIGCAAVMVVCYWIVVLLIREPPLSSEQLAVIEQRRRDQREFFLRHFLGIGRVIKHAFTNRYFVLLFLSVLTYQVGVLAGLWFYTFLLEDWFGKTWNTPFAQTYLVGPLSPLRDAFFLYILVAVGFGVFCLPFWNWLGKYLEKRTCLMLGIIGIGLTYGSSYWLFAPKSFPLLIAYCLLQAFFYCPANIYPISMMADVATYDEWKNGEPNEGLFYGANSFLVKLYNAVAVVWTGYALEHLVRYSRGEGAVQTAEALHRMRVLYAFPAMVAAFVAVLFLLKYDLNRQRMAAIVKALADRGDQGPIR